MLLGVVVKQVVLLAPLKTVVEKHHVAAVIHCPQDFHVLHQVTEIIVLAEKVDRVVRDRFLQHVLKCKVAFEPLNHTPVVGIGFNDLIVLWVDLVHERLGNVQLLDCFVDVPKVKVGAELPKTSFEFTKI